MGKAGLLVGRETQTKKIAMIINRGLTFREMQFDEGVRVV